MSDDSFSLVPDLASGNIVAAKKGGKDVGKVTKQQQQHVLENKVWPTKVEFPLDAEGKPPRMRKVQAGLLHCVALRERF